MSRWTINRNALRGRTAVSPKIERMLSTPRPRTSRKSRSIGGQRPWIVSGPICCSSTTSSATRPWPREMSSSASSLLPIEESPVMSTPISSTSRNTPCRVVTSPSSCCMKGLSTLITCWLASDEVSSAVPAFSAASARTAGAFRASHTITHTVSPRQMPAEVCSRPAGSRRSRYSSSRRPMTCASNGWMRFRCPMRPTPGLCRISPLNSRSLPATPAAHARPRRSRRASNSRCTLSRGIGRPLGDQPVGRLDVGRRGERLAQARVAEHLRELREELEVGLRRMLRDEHREHQPHGLAVGRLERDRGRGAYEGAHRLLERLDAPVGNRHAVAQARRAEFLALEQAVEDARPRNRERILEREPDLLEQPLLAARLEVEQDVVERQQARDEVQRSPWSMRLIPCAWRTWKRSLCLSTWRSSLSMRPSIAAYMSPSFACSWMSFPDRCTLASIFWSSFSTVMITFTSITWSKCRLMRSSFETT